MESDASCARGTRDLVKVHGKVMLTEVYDCSLQITVPQLRIIMSYTEQYELGKLMNSE